jgi:hypothetical protein
MEQFRTRKGIRRVEHTVGGRTELVDVPVQIREPVQPLDLDAVVAHALAVVTFLVVLGAMAWSTVAIGTLLHRMAPAWVSYLVAVVYDLSWASCMGAEYLMRYDRRRVWVPRCAGFLALVVSVLTIELEGWLTTHSWVIGAAGGMISVLAKGLWTVVMMISTRKLSELDQAWYTAASSRAGAEEATVAIQRRLARSQAKVLREREALGLPPLVPESVPAPADVPDPLPAAGSGSAPATVPDPLSGSVPAALPVPFRIPAAAPVRRSGSGFGPVLDRVWIRIRSGMDPELDKGRRILEDILAEDPSADPETVRRMIRTARNALASQAPANP